MSLYEDAQEEALRRLQAMAAAGAAPAAAPPVAPPRALPRATRKASAGGTLSTRVQPGEENIRRGLELMSAEDDYTAASDFARQRSLQGEDAMLNAIAASVAGRRFEPLQGAFLKRAMAAQDPMKVGTATIGPDGTVLRDPSAGREREAGRLLQLGQFEMGLADRQQARADAAADRAANRALRMTIAQMRGAPTAQAEAPAPQVSASGAESTAKLITPEVRPNEALGLSGFWQRGINNVADMFGAADPKNPARVATDRLEALGNQTQLYLQAAVPGRPSNYLLQILEKQAIRPNQLFMGEAGAQTRAQATVAVIDTGLELLSGILKKPDAYSRKEIVEATDSYNRLSQLKSEYNALLGTFDGGDVVDDEIAALLQQYGQ